MLILGLMLAWPVAAEDVTERVGECEACHGSRGISTEDDVPSLAGKSVSYLLEMLNQFTYYERHCSTTTYRDGDRARTPTSMCNVANSLSEQDKRALAEYFSAAEDRSAADR